MKAKLFVVTLAAASALAVAAKAQDTIIVPGEVDSYVAEQPYDDTVTYDEDVIVGDTLPDEVVVRQVPDYDDYGYAVIKRKKVIVEPRTRRVIKVYR